MVEDEELLDMFGDEEGKYNLKCPKCSFQGIYTRIRTNEHVCKKCAYKWEDE